MAPTRLGVAIIGLGWGSQVHVTACRQAGLDVRYLCARTEGMARAAASRLGVSGHASDWREPLSDELVSIVVVATSPASQVEISREALRARKLVVVEKPVGLSLGAIRTLEALQPSDRKVAVCLQRRWLAGRSVFRDRLAHIGTIHAIEIDTQETAWRVPISNWKLDVTRGGGPIVALGIHDLDLLAWLDLGMAHIDEAAMSTSGYVVKGSTARGVAAQVSGELAGSRVRSRIVARGADGTVALEDDSDVVRIETLTRYRTSLETVASSSATEAMTRLLDAWLTGADDVPGLGRAAELRRLIDVAQLGQVTALDSERRTS